MVDISKHYIKILAQRHISIAMNDKAAHDALASEPQTPFAPLVLKGYEVIVLLCFMNAVWYLLDEIFCFQQFCCGIEKCHCSIDADT